MKSLMQTAALAAATFVVAGLALAQQPAARSGIAPTRAGVAPTDAQQPPASAPSDPVVTVDGVVLTEADMDKMLVAGLEAQGRKVTPAQIPMFKQRFRNDLLNVMIDNQLFDAAAEKESITVEEKEVIEKVEEDLDGYAKVNNLSKEEMAEKVQKSTGMELKDYIAKRGADPFLRTMLRRGKLIEKLFPEKLQVSEAEIKEHYEKNLESTYSQPAKVRASHILFGTRNKSEEEKAAARKQAEEVLAELKKPDADFAELARKHSDCPSKQRGGDLDFFPRQGAMVEPFAEAAFALKPGEISDIVETQFGYHIIKTTDRQEASTTSLEDAKEVIREQLHRQKISKQMQAYSAELREDAKIVYPEGKEPTTQPAFGAARPTTQPAATPQ